MTIGELKTLLTSISGGEFSLSATQLGIDNVNTLFETYLPGGALTLTNAQPTVDELQVSGQMTLGNAKSVQTIVTFLADANNTSVTGINIKLSLSSWNFTAPFADFTGTALQSFGFTSPLLLLNAGGSDFAAGAPAAFIGGTLAVKGTGGTKNVSLLAQIPYGTPASRAGIVNNYVFEIELDDVTLADLNALTQFVRTVQFKIIPSTIPVADSLALKHIEFVLDPRQNQLVSLRLTVGSAKALSVVKDIFEIDSFIFSFQIIMPSVATQVYGVVATTLEISGQSIEMALSLPDLYLTGALGHDDPVPLKPLVSKFLSRNIVPDDFKLSALSFGLGLEPPHNYVFDITLRDVWSVSIGNQTLQMTSLSVSLEGAGATPPGLSIQGQIAFAGTLLYLSAEHQQNATGWLFKGGTVGAGSIGFPGFEPSGLQVGDLIRDLGTKFGISLPKPIESFTLQDIQVQFVGGAAQQASPEKFSFGCTGKFSIAGNEFNATISIDITQRTSGAVYDKNARGTILVKTAGGATETFNITFSSNDQDEFINVNWSASEDHELTIEDVAHAFGFSDLPDLPPLLKGLGLSNVTFTYDFTKQVLVAGLVIKETGASKSFGGAVFITATLSSSSQVYIIGLDVHLGVKLADIPLVGDKLPDAQNLGTDDAGIWVLSQPLLKSDVEHINPLIDSSKYPTLPDTAITAKVLLNADLQLGSGAATPLQLSLGSDSTQASQPTAAAPSSGGLAIQPVALSAPVPQGTLTATSTTDNTKWLNIEKQFGVFQFKRIGINYKDNNLLFALDAAITMGPLTFSLDGLSIGSPLTRFDPKFDLTGLGMAYVKPPLEIMGGLLKIPGTQLAPNVDFQFDGVLVMKGLSYSLSAIGSYAQTHSGPSLFVFAQLEAALGGPPFFFVTGLMAGFGFNRSLSLPAQDEVMDFPLLVLAQPPSPGEKVQQQDPMHVLDVLEGRAPITTGGETKQWIAPSTGAYWLAVGIEFTSFELVKSKALLIVEFGNDFQVALLGLSTMRLPQEGDQLYAYVEMQLRAVFQPQAGFFGLTAILSSNSFVIDPACHLTGGFAFYIWFGSNPNAGQFVITLGGYHPAFKPPDYFPQVPRLGFNWTVSDVVSVSGDAYFALTTSCVMAGGGLEVLFHDGDLRAWFTAHADILIAWHPFFFSASIDVEIGVSYSLNLLFCHKTISISIGASVDMWGPPTGGNVHVHLWVVSFTVHFGSDGAGQTNDPLDWPGFKNLLPSPNDVCKVTISDGLYKSQDSTVSNSGQAWIVRAANFKCFTQSTIPSSQLAYGAASPANSIAALENSGINIRPMNLTAVTSNHSVNIYKDLDPAAVTALSQGQSITNPQADLSKWSFQPRHQNLPESLWGAPPAHFTQIPGRPTANVIPDQPVGYDVQAPQPVIGSSPGLIQLTEVSEDYVMPPSNSPISSAVAVSPDYLPSFNNTVTEIKQIMTGNALTNRDSLFNELQAAGIYKGTNGTLINMAAQAAHIFSDSPMQQL